MRYVIYGMIACKIRTEVPLVRKRGRICGERRDWELGTLIRKQAFLRLNTEYRGVTLLFDALTSL